MPRRKHAKGSAAGAGSGGAGSGAGSGAGAGGGRKNVAAMSVEEQVLRDVYALYKNPGMVSNDCGSVGIEEMSRRVGARLLYPSKKITVMLIGNHSAGKSSFINWYAEKRGLQRTAVAVESQGFTLVTHGERSDLVRGESCIEMKPYLRGIEKFDGVLPHLEVRVSTSEAKEFTTIDFLDTPGLIDGEVRYPFDVNNIILWMAQHVDLIFVFMDPIGQALCTRTMNVVRMLDKAKHGGKMKFFLTKADVVPNSQDLINIIAQTVANLSRHVSDHHGLKVPALWIDGKGGSSGIDSSHNYLGQLVADLSDCVKQKVQVNMSRLKSDCGKLSAAIDKEVAVTAKKTSVRFRWRMYQILFSWLLGPLMCIMSFLDLMITFEDRVPEVIMSGPLVRDGLEVMRAPVQLLGHVASAGGLTSVWRRQGVFLALYLFIYTLAAFFAWRVRRIKCRSKDDLRAFREYKKHLAVMRKKGQDINTKYLQATQRPEGFDE